MQHVTVVITMAEIEELFEKHGGYTQSFWDALKRLTDLRGLPKRSTNRVSHSHAWVGRELHCTSFDDPRCEWAKRNKKF